MEKGSVRKEKLDILNKRATGPGSSLMNSGDHKMKLKETFLNMNAKLRLLKPFLHLTPIYTETSNPEYFLF